MESVVRVEPVAAFADNYIWLLSRDDHAVVVDPGDAAPVLARLEERGLRLGAILVTHHHEDHVGGVAALVAATGARVLGPAGGGYQPLDAALRDGDRIELLGHVLRVIAVPGHTLDHIAYWDEANSALFCGDTLFAGGCGRLFEGTPAQMYGSLARLAALPGATRVFCAHEYTLANLRFAAAVEPGNLALQERQRVCERLRAEGVATVPSRLDEELATNPFLRCGVLEVQASAHAREARCGSEGAEVFRVLREWKNGFR